MSIGVAVKRRIMNHLFSVERRDARRRKAEHARRSNGARHLVEYFHEAGDPYSHLVVQMLPEFVRRYDVDLRVHIAPPPPDWAAPDRGKLETYSRLDAARLAGKAALSFVDHGRQPDDVMIAEATRHLVSAVERGAFLEYAAEIGETLWRGGDFEAIDLDRAAVDDALAKADARRDELGHYLGATLHYAGEWYWGPDRLHFLEARLADLGAVRDGAPQTPIYAQPTSPQAGAAPVPGLRPELHWYLSFRSPYTAIVADRVKALADAYSADLKLRFVLPMVMRGLQVPRKKGFYITSDVVREAERLRVPFGDIADPVGAPVERGYAVLQYAIEQGRGFAFAQSFLRGVWAEGVNAGSDRGLQVLAERAGLNWAEAKLRIGRDDWRAEEDANQAEMLELGLWGVPSFRVGSVSAWGQDRLWVIEDALASGEIG